MILAIPLGILTWIVAGCLPGGDGIVAEQKLPDGTRIVIYQKYQSFAEPYAVGLYTQEPGENWGWCYLDHEDSRWWHARIDHDPATDTVQVWKGKSLRGRWHRKEKVYERPDIPGWAAEAPQQIVDNPPFLPRPASQ